MLKKSKFEKLLWKISFILCFFAIATKIDSTELSFAIVISSYNNAKWVKRNLDSVFNQNYYNFRVIYIDDASQDGTADIVEAYIQEHKLQQKITLIKNTYRSRKLRNIYNVYYLCQDHELIAQLDGDDWLAHPDVLSLLNTIFSTEDVWLSYGQFMHSTGKIGFCRDISLPEKQNALFRQLPLFVTSHLKVFYAWLFKMVKLQDLLVESIPGWEGFYYPYANDCATIYPMLEMARERVRFNSEVVYIFNRDNPISGHNSQLALQNMCNRELKTLPVYSKLSKPVLKRLEHFKKATIECLVLSDNPCSLSATLQSIKKYIPEIPKIIIWYQPHQDTANEYQKLKEQFRNADFYNVDTDNVLPSLEVGLGKYVLCMCDKIVLNAPLNYKKWIMELERTFAYACYGLLTCTEFEEYEIPYQHIQGDLYAWKFLCDKQGSINPHNFGCTLYRKNDFISAYQHKKIQTLEDIVQLWTSRIIDARKVGIFFDATSEACATKLCKNI